MTNFAVALEAKALLGECPRWHPTENKLYWVDIDKGELHRLDPQSGADEVMSLGAPIGCFAFTDGGGFLLAMKDGFSFLERWGGKPRPFGEQIFRDRSDLRFNDGRTDSHGRFWVGSVNMDKSAHDAALYRLEGNGSITMADSGMLTCNGAAFSPDQRCFYHSDTPTHLLCRYDYDVANGHLGPRKPFHGFPEGKGRPDGGSVDAEGCYWVALFDGGRVVRISPDGDIVESVNLPVSRPTMITLGGPDLRTAYVTTARKGLSDEALLSQPLAGAIFSFPVATPGLKEQPFDYRG